MQNVVEGLIQKPSAQAMARVGRQDIDRAARDKIVERLDAVFRGKIGLQRFDLGAVRSNAGFASARGRSAATTRSNPSLARSLASS